MKKFNKLFKIGTFVKIEGQDNFNQITEINESRNLIKVDGLEGSFQRGHVVQYSNAQKQNQTIYTIKQDDLGSIHSISSQHHDRNIVFQKDCEFAVVLASYYGGKGYTTHKTINAAIQASKKLSDYSHVIIDQSGTTFESPDDMLEFFKIDLY